MDSKINKALKQELEIPTNLSKRLEELIDSLPEERTTSKKSLKMVRRRMVLWLSSTAAVVTLLCALAINSANNDLSEPQFKDTYADVKEAELVAIETFKLVAQNYRKGTQTVQVLSDEITKVNQTITQTITIK